MCLINDRTEKEYIEEKKAFYNKVVTPKAIVDILERNKVSAGALESI